MSGSDICIQRALEANPLREPALHSVIASLQLPQGSHGLDAGCGIGLQGLMLAQAVGPAGHVTGMDMLPELPRYGRGLVGKQGYLDRVLFCQGDVGRFPFRDHAFDWAWSSDCIGYPVGDLSPVLKELVRIVKPGGRVILLAWSSQQLLPGYPLLEARLNATCSGYIPFLEGVDPDLNFMRAARWFREAGLEEVRVQTFVGDVQAPLRSEERLALVSLFEMLWGAPQPQISPEDWEAYQRLCLPDSPDFILDVDGYYAFFTITLIQGKIPRA